MKNKFQNNDTSNINFKYSDLPEVNQYNIVKTDYNNNIPTAPIEHCYVRAFFENQKKLHPNLRSNTCMISCPCSKCNRFTY